MGEVVVLSDYRKKPRFDPFELPLAVSREYALAGAAMLALIAEILEQQGIKP